MATAEKRREYRRRDYWRRREIYLRQASEYQRAYPDRVRVAARRYRALHPDKRRDTILRYRYKLSLAAFMAMVEQQGGRCFVCEQMPKRLYVDHDHRCCPKTPTCGRCTRGLVCNGCNTQDRASKMAIEAPE